MGALVDFRERVAAVLTPLNADWQVNVGPVDAISPPAFVCTYPDGDWLDPATTPCVHRARVRIICAAARIDPVPGYDQLDAMVIAAIPALAAGGWPLAVSGGVTSWECGGLHYLAARLTVSELVTL